MTVVAQAGRPRLSPRAAVVELLVVYWWLAVWNLERTPQVNEGEALIVSLGYRLFTQGAFGTGLYAGFHAMDRHYFLVTPLMSVLQGAVARLMGLGVLTMRWVPAAAGLLTLALTFAAGRKLVGPSAAVLALVLLIFWQWAQPGATALVGTGIPLLDTARVARHDILVPPLGLAALCAYLQPGRSRHRVRLDLAAGILVGLAGLGHLYGLFWGPALAGLAALERKVQPAARRLALLAAGAGLVWLPVAAFISAQWADFTAQVRQSAGRFDLLNASFYLDNLLNEPHRYQLGWQSGSAWLRAGAWLLLLGVPAALLWTAWDSVRGDRRALRLLVPAVVFPALFALLIQPKLFNYLVAVAPLFALLVARGARRLWLDRPSRRWLVEAWLGLVVLQGAAGVAAMQIQARQAPSPAVLAAQLRHLVPPTSRVLGHERYWLPLYDRDFRSFGLPFFLSSPAASAEPIAFGAALAQVAPRFVLLDPVMRAAFAGDVPGLDAGARADFSAYMAAHDAEVIGTLPDGPAGPLQVYRLKP